MNQTIINLGPKKYSILIDGDLISKIDFKKYIHGKYAIITDTNVKKLYGLKLDQSLKKQGFEGILLDFQSGEKSKNFETAVWLGRALAKDNLDRNLTIIALGGGVVGDLAGFVASFYKRGVDYIQVPTTLLAQIDASIGGKVGVNIPEGKNLFGYFHQPKAVIVDINALRTLAESELRNGLAEAVKYGMTLDKEIFENIENSTDFENEDFLFKIIIKSIKTKVKVVEEDEYEKNLRKVLNYGHTVGQAIEAIQGYKITHGEALGIGMAYEGKIAEKLGLLNKKDLYRQNQLIRKIGFPIEWTGSSKWLIKAMRQDKKNKGDRLHFVLPISIGRVKRSGRVCSFPVEESIVRECLDEN